MNLTEMTVADERIIALQLGRTPRSVVGVAWRCPCGKPGVIATEPRLPDGSPFPTFYYLTYPQLVVECSRLEATGLMAELTDRVQTDPELKTQYEAAHEAYLADRESIGHVPEIEGISAGGMPNRVKCLHALVGHSLAAGPGVNPIGDLALSMMDEFNENQCLHEKYDPKPEES